MHIKPNVLFGSKTAYHTWNYALVKFHGTSSISLMFSSKSISLMPPQNLSGYSGGFSYVDWKKKKIDWHACCVLTEFTFGCSWRKCVKKVLIGVSNLHQVPPVYNSKWTVRKEFLSFPISWNLRVDYLTILVSLFRDCCWGICWNGVWSREDPWNQRLGNLYLHFIWICSTNWTLRTYTAL